jgi:glucose-1-phosphate thymidylyltransferase
LIEEYPDQDPIRLTGAFSFSPNYKMVPVPADCRAAVIQNTQNNVVGLIPGAGHGTRIAPLPCSKEIFPIGYRLIDGGREKRPKVACHYLLEKMREAGITKAYIVLREGKWDIPTYLCDGRMLQMHLAYLMVGLSLGVPYTLDQAYPFVRDAVVAFGFPDILFDGDDAFRQLLSYQTTSDADILLGLFPADQPEKMDMVDVEENGRVRAIVIKPPQTQLQYSWAVAIWTPVFTQFLHNYLANDKTLVATQPELSVGHVIEAAASAGLRVEGFPVSGEPYLDIGSSEGLANATTRFAAVV